MDLLRRINHGQLVLKIKKNSILSGALNLMLSSGIISLFGFVFWIVVAHGYNSNDVGVATTLIASSLLISLLSQAGFDTSFIRFLPKSKHKSAHIDTGLVVSGGASILIALAFCYLTPLMSPRLSFIAYNPLYTAEFVFFTLFGTWNALTNAALIANRKTGYILAIDTVFSIVKVTLPFLIVSGGAMAIFAVVGIAQVVNVGLSLLVLVCRFDYHPKLKIDSKVIKETKRYGSGMYISNVLNLLPDSLLPLIVLAKLGTSSSAYFYFAFAIANLVYTIAFSITQVLLAETSHDETDFQERVRKGLRIAIFLLTPAIILVITLSGFILRLFGKEYSLGGTGLLQAFALSGFFVLVYSFIGFIFKHKKDIASNILMNTINAIGILVTSFILIDHFGLIGAGYAWLVGTMMAVAVGYTRVRSRIKG